LQHEKVSNLLAKYIGKPISQIESLAPVLGSSLDLSAAGNSLNQGLGSSTLDLDLSSSLTISNNTALPHHLKGISDMEKALMLETADSAMDELIRLLRINEPLWIKSPADGRYVLHRDSYEKIFPRANHFKNSSARVESSKDSGMVTLSGMHLVEMILDSVSFPKSFFSYLLCCKINPQISILLLEINKFKQSIQFCRING
jgi:homeobox-leucine zipper protein